MTRPSLRHSARAARRGRSVRHSNARPAFAPDVTGDFSGAEITLSNRFDIETRLLSLCISSDT